MLAKTGPEGPAWNNPLWLVLAVEELNLLDADDFARAERIFGANLVRGFLGLIAVSRSGWREIDFRILLPRASGQDWHELKFAQLRRIFRGQLRQHGALAQWDFSHGQMHAAVRARLAAVGTPSELSLRTVIADWLLSCPPDDPLHISETMVHLLASEDCERAAGYYGGSSLSDTEVQGATRALGDAIAAPAAGGAVTAAVRIARLLDIPDPALCACLAEGFVFNLDNSIEGSASLEVRRIIIDSAKQALERSVQTERDNIGWQRNLSVSYAKLGDLQLLQGELAGALESYGLSFAFAERLAQVDGTNSEWQRDVRVMYAKTGKAQVARGDLAAAMQSYRSAQRLLENAVRNSPANTGQQAELSALHAEIGNVHEAQGNLTSALISYRESAGINERLAHSDQGNLARQYDLSLSYGRLADIHKAQGDVADALGFYSKALALVDRLTKLDPANANWQRDLSLTYSREGDVQRAQGDLARALSSYRYGYSILDRLARSDPSNAGRQRDACMFLGSVGQVLMAQGNVMGARLISGEPRYRAAMGAIGCRQSGVAAGPVSFV